MTGDWHRSRFARLLPILWAMAPLVRICAVTAALLVLAGFTLFAIDQLYEGSENQSLALKGNALRAQTSGMIDQPAPPAAIERIRERANSPARELIDDANDVLLSPFASIVESTDPWPPRMVSGGLALLLFGLGGMFIANALPRRHNKATDWREATT